MFFEEISNSFGLDIKALKEFSFLNVANSGVAVFGKYDIVFYNTTKIILKSKHNYIYIYGQNLSIKSMNNTSFCVVGKIFCTSDREVTLC